MKRTRGTPLSSTERASLQAFIVMSRLYRAAHWTGWKETLKLTKMDAARRQFSAALELWFADGDPVAIHTLAAAAFEVVTQIAKHRGVKVDKLVAQIATMLSCKPEDVYRGLKVAPNFFKHADRDPEGELLFEPEWSTAFLAGCMTYLLCMGEEIAGIEVLFKIRLALERPHQYPSAALEKLSSEQIEMLRTLTRSEFWDLYSKGEAPRRSAPPAGHQAR
jgi:hypothetical protein